MMINISGKMGKITNTNEGKKLNNPEKVINSLIRNEEIDNDNFSSSDSEFMSCLDSERNLICLKQDDAVLKKKEVSGHSPHKLSNFILHMRKTPFDTNSSGTSVSNSFINMNINNTCSMRNIHAYDRVGEEVSNHNNSELRCSNWNANLNKVSQSVHVPRLRLPVYKAKNKQNWFDLNNNKGPTANNTNNATCIFTNMIDVNDYCDSDKSELILRGCQGFYVKKRRGIESRVVQAHGNIDNDVGGRIDLTPHMKYNIRYLRKEKLTEIVIIQSFWRASASRKRRKIMSRIILIQSVWRGHWLRIVLYNSIFRYYSGRAFLEHVKRVNDMNRKMMGKIFLEKLKKFEKLEKSQGEYAGVQCQDEIQDHGDVLLLYNKNKINFSLNKNLSNQKKNYFSDRYDYNEDNIISHNDDERIFTNNEIIKNISLEGVDEINIDSQLEIESQFQFEEDEEGYDEKKFKKNKNFIQTESQNFSKLEFIREYLENKINSMELIHNDSFKIESNINQVKKFDNLLKEFNSFTIEINKLASSTSNILKNIPDYKNELKEFKLQNNICEEKLSHFEADRFHIIREYERMKNNFSNHGRNHKNNSDLIKIPSQKHQGNREQPEEYYLNDNNINTNAANHYKFYDLNIFKAYDFDSGYNLQTETCNIKENTIKILRHENVNNFELISESSIKSNPYEFKSHFDLEKVHDLYYDACSEFDKAGKKVDLTTISSRAKEHKSLEVIVECSISYKSILKKFLTEKVYNINYSPTEQESQGAYSASEDKSIQTYTRELEVAAIEGIFYESIKKKFLLEAYKNQEISYPNISKILSLEINKEHDINFTYSPKVVGNSICKIENCNYIGQDRTELYEVSSSLIEMAYLGVCIPATLNLEIQKENEVNYLSNHEAHIISLEVSKEYDYADRASPNNYNITKELELIYEAHAKIPILKYVKETELSYHSLDKLNNLEEVKQSIDLEYKAHIKEIRLEICSFLYTMSHTPIKRSLDIVDVCELSINKLIRPDLTQCTAYDIIIINQPLKKALSQEAFCLQLINQKPPNQALHQEEFTISRIRQFTFDILSHHSDVACLFYDKVQKVSIIDLCVSLEITKVKKQENVISDNEINIIYNNGKHNLIKNIFLKNAGEICQKTSVAFFKWKCVTKEFSRKERENLLKNIFCLRSIYNLVNKKNVNQIKKRFTQWRLIRFEISNKLIAVIVVKKITNAINKNIKSSMFEILIYNLNANRVEKLKKVYVENILRKLQFSNLIRLLKEFDKWKLFGIKICHKEKILGIIFNKTSKKFSEKKKRRCFRIWKSFMEFRRKNAKILLLCLDSLFTKNYQGIIIKCFDQLKIFSLLLEYNQKLKYEKLKNILKDNDNRKTINLKMIFENFRNIMNEINRKENFILKDKINLINFSKEREIKLLRILKRKENSLWLELLKHLTSWKNYTEAIKKKSFINEVKSFELEYIHHKKQTEEKEISFNYRDYLNYSIDDGVKYFEYIPDLRELIKLRQALLDVSQTERMELICPRRQPIYKIHSAYEIQHVYKDQKYNSYSVKQADAFEIGSILDEEDFICQAVQQFEITALPASHNEVNEWLITNIENMDLYGLLHIPIITSESTAQTEEIRRTWDFSNVYSLEYCCHNELEYKSEGVNTEIINNYVIAQIYRIDCLATYEVEDNSNKYSLRGEHQNLLRKSSLLFKLIKAKEITLNACKHDYIVRWRHISPLLSDRRADRTAQISQRAISTINGNITHSSLNNNTSSVDMISFVSNTDEECEEFTEEEAEDDFDNAEQEEEGEEDEDDNDEEEEDDEVIVENIKAPRIVKRQLILQTNNQVRKHSIYTIKNFHTLPNGDEVEYSIKNKIYSIFVKYESPLLYYFNKWQQNKTKLTMRFNLSQTSYSSENEISIFPNIKIIKKNQPSQHRLKNFRHSIRTMRFSTLAKINMNVGYYFSKWKNIANKINSYANSIKRQLGLKKAFRKWKKLSEENFASGSYHHSRSLSYRTDEESVHIVPKMVTVLQKLRIFNSVNKPIEPSITQGHDINQAQFYLDDIIDESFDTKSKCKEEIRRVYGNILKVLLPHKTKSFCFKKWKTACKRLKKDDYVRMKLLSLERIRRKVIKKLSMHKWKKHIVVLKINKIKIENRAWENNEDDCQDSVIKLQKIHFIKVDKKSGLNRLNLPHSSSSSVSGLSYPTSEKYNFNKDVRDMPSSLSIRFMKILNLLDKVIYNSIIRMYFNNWRRGRLLIGESEHVLDSSDEEAFTVNKIKPMTKVKSNLNDFKERVLSSGISREINIHNTHPSSMKVKISQDEFKMSFDKSLSDSKPKFQRWISMNNLSEIKLEFLGDLIRKIKLEKYFSIIKTSIDAMNKNSLCNEFNDFFGNLSKNLYTEKLKKITINFLLISVITKHIKNPLNFKRAFGMWFKNTFNKGNNLTENTSTNYSTGELILLYEEQIKSKETKDRLIRLNSKLSKIISSKTLQENLKLQLYFNKIRSNVQTQILSEKADILITQAKKFLIKKNRRVIKSLKLDNLMFSDSIYFPTNRMPNLRDSQRLIYSERKTRNDNAIYSPSINRSEKILKSKTNLPECFKKKFSDILDNSVDDTNFLKSSLSIENEEDDCAIISAIQIQSAWRYFRQKRYLIGYSKWLKVMKELIERMDKNNVTRMQLALVNWRRVNFFFKLTEAVNSITGRYVSNLKQKESKLVMKALCKSRKLRIIIKTYCARNSSMRVAKYLLNWRNISAYMKQASAADYIKSKLKTYIQRKKLKSILFRAYHQSIFKAFLLFADAYNYNDRVSYLSYVVTKTKRRLFYKRLIRLKFDEIIRTQLIPLNEINLTESRRAVLKLWLRKMKLLRRKDHSMMKMLRIIKLNVKHTIILALKLNSLINNIDKYKKKLLRSVFYKLKEEQ